MTTRSEYTTALQKLNRWEIQVREAREKLSRLQDSVEDLTRTVLQMQEELNIKPYDTPGFRARKALITDQGR